VLLQESVQYTPDEDASFETVALTVACAVAAMLVGGSCVIVTGKAERIVVVAVAGFEGLEDEEAAVIVTTLFVGTVAGAV
jgi:hypothetical protein